MNKETDSSFNEIVYVEILPAIAKAFCELAKESSNNSIIERAKTKGICQSKANTLKDFISHYIDGQINAICTTKTSSEMCK